MRVATMNDLDHLTLPEAAKRNSVSVWWLRQHLRDVEPLLPHRRTGRKIIVEREALARWFALFEDTEIGTIAKWTRRFRRDYPTAA
jgi:hypothetical protein